MKKIDFSLFLLLVSFLVSCGSEYNAKIKEAEKLETALKAHFTPALSDSLVNLYKTLGQSEEGTAAEHLRFFTRAAEIQFILRSDAGPAVRWIDDGLQHDAEGQDLGDIIGLLTRIWNGYTYKSASTAKLRPDDIDGTRAHLLKNQQWIDSALVRLDRKMHSGGPITDEAAAAEFLEIAEGYASIVNDPDKYTDLLSKAAGLAKSIGQYNKSLQLYYKISTRMPEHPRAKTALFMQAFIYENDLHDLDKAKTAYEDFLQKYPNDPDFGDDAQIALKTLGKSPEELIQSFQQQEQE